MHYRKTALLVALSGLLALAACKKATPHLSKHWVQVQVKLENRFELSKIRQLTLIVDSVSPAGPALGLPAACGNLPSSGVNQQCSALCEDYDHDGHQEFILDCTGQPEKLFPGLSWNYLLYGEVSEHQQPFKLRVYLRGETGLLGSAEARSDALGNPIVFDPVSNPRVSIFLPCLPGTSCGAAPSPQCQLNLSGPASATVNEGEIVELTYAIGDSADKSYTWEVKMAGGEDALPWSSLSMVNETSARLRLAPPVGTPANTPNASFLIQAGGADCTNTLELMVAVKETNQPPVLFPIGDVTVQAGVMAVRLLEAFDPDQGNRLAYSLSGHPKWMEIVEIPASPARQAWLVLTPPANALNTFGPVTLKIHDNGASPGEDSTQFTIQTVLGPANSPPVLLPVGNLTLSAGSTREVPLFAADREGLEGGRFILHNQPTWAGLYGQTPGHAVLRLSPPMGQSADWPGMIIRFADGQGAADQEIITILLNRDSHKPTLSAITAQTVAEGLASAREIPLSATDQDLSESFTFQLKNQPYWVRLLDSNRGDEKAKLTIQPPPGSAGLYRDIVVSVRDKAGLAGWQRFDLTVSDGNTHPVLHPLGNRLCPAGRQSQYILSAWDPDNDKVAFSLDQAALGWMTIEDADANDNQALLKCAPSAGIIGSFGVKVIAEDGQGGKGEELIHLLVDVGCRAPPSGNARPAPSLSRRIPGNRAVRRG